VEKIGPLRLPRWAINSPLLEDISIDQAQGVLINMTGSTGMTMEEVMEGSSFIKNEGPF